MKNSVDVVDAADRERPWAIDSALAEQRAVELVQHHGVERLELHGAEPRNDVQPHDPRVARVGAGADGRLMDGSHR